MAEAVIAVPMVRVKVPLAKPLPVSSTVSGEVGSELVTVSEPGREPIADGVKVTVSEQLWPGASVASAHGVVMA